MTRLPRLGRVALLVAVAVSVVAAFTTACGGSHGHAAVEVADAWARSSAATQDSGAAYMEIMGGAEDDVLLSIAAPAGVAAEAQVHEMVPVDHEAAATGSDMEMDMADHAASGELEMRHVTRLDVPAGEMVMLEPGGFHVMLTQLAKPLVAGERFDLVLSFERAGEITVPVEVREN